MRDALKSLQMGSHIGVIWEASRTKTRAGSNLNPVLLSRFREFTQCRNDGHLQYGIGIRRNVRRSPY